jgi:hypothetical protein
MSRLPISGDGSGKGVIQATEIAPDWVLLSPEGPEPWPENLPIGLSKVLRQWADEQRNVRIRAALPIVKGGDLIAVHVWFDRVSTSPT